jgi:hypothetical protein
MRVFSGGAGVKLGVVGRRATGIYDVDDLAIRPTGKILSQWETSK